MLAQSGHHTRFDGVRRCPPPGAISHAADEPGRWVVQYGREGTGSYFELVDGVVTLAVLRQPKLPAHMRDSPPMGEWSVR